jgi:hypothetical protein
MPTTTRIVFQLLEGYTIVAFMEAPQVMSNKNIAVSSVHVLIRTEAESLPLVCMQGSRPPSGVSCFQSVDTYA